MGRWGEELVPGTRPPDQRLRRGGFSTYQWFSPHANVRERYDHLYSVEELESWVDRIFQIAKDTRDTYAVPNNHNVGKGPANVFEIAAMVSGAK